MVVVQKEGEEHKLYFVAETKGSMDDSQLKTSESNKILCGKKHFEVLNTDVRYKVVNDLLALKNA